MEQNSPTQKAIKPLQNSLLIKVFGVGNAGISVMERMIRNGISGAEFVAVNTETRSVAESSAAKKLHLETKLLRELGTGGDPEIGQALAEEHLPELRAACEGAGMVFIVAGLGGGAGTGISPVLARAAKEAGALALAFVTTPFACEGGRRQRLAQHGLEALKVAADGVVCLPNQKVFKLIDENTSVLETFKITGGMLAEAMCGVWRLLAQPGLIEIHFADLSALIRERHSESFFAVAEAMGPTRSRDVVDKLLAHPMLDDGQVLTESDALLVSLTGGPDLTMAEVNRVMERLSRHCEHAQAIMGAAIDESFRDRLTVTLIAARKVSERPEAEGKMQPGGFGYAVIDSHDRGAAGFKICAAAAVVAAG